MNQTTLFGPVEHLPKWEAASAAKPGTGPVGQTCKSCMHCTRVQLRSGKAFHKCALMRRHWTHSGGSDIKLKWPACSEWHPSGKTLVAILRRYRAVFGEPTWPSNEDFLIFADHLEEQGDPLCEAIRDAVQNPSMNLLALLQNGGNAKIPEWMATCPECDGQLWANATSWDAQTGHPTEIELECVNEDIQFRETAKMDEDGIPDAQFMDSHNHHQSEWQPVIDEIWEHLGGRP